MTDITLHKRFIRYEVPVQFEGFKAIGYFPYHTASVRPGNCNHPPRTLYNWIEKVLPRTDNKYVVLFEDEVDFATSNFAIYFKDYYAAIGNWEDVKAYDSKEL